MIAVCFVCHGNICRSPTAEAVFATLVERAGLQHAIAIESAGCSDEHAGESPDRRSERVAALRGYSMRSCARRFERDDFARFDLVVAMDRHNRSHLERIAASPRERAKVKMLREYDADDPRPLDVPDPWYGGGEGFDEVLAICERACEGLLAELRRSHGL
jgi:protein-tyrosine phosphatase